jgi:hypothetical protein
MAVLFGLTLFASAALVFSVQPMVAKMLLPLLGGAPAVWNTCMVFFQAILLAGYAYAHFLSTRVSLAGQKAVHLSLMLATCFVLPIGLSSASSTAPWNTNPIVWLLQALVLAVGLPFFTISSSAPLLQSWFSRTRHPSAGDPYFLYAASNLGSVLGLIAYPALLEPRLHIPQQARLWMFLYFGLVLLFAACAVLGLAGANRKKCSEAPVRSSLRPENAESGVTWPRRLSWVFWAFIPSSLMLGVTTYLTTDIASVPLLWTVPLTLYLLTFILAFKRGWKLPQRVLTRLVVILAVVLAFVMLAKSDELAWLQIGLHLVFFVCAALAWHTRLANDRPESRSLTDFYFCISIGGVLGGLFNALLAPMIFRAVVEYPLLIVLACIRWPDRADSGGTRAAAVVAGAGRLGWHERLGWSWSLLLWPLSVGLLTAGLSILAPQWGLEPHVRTMAVFGVPAILCYLASKQKGTLHFALTLGALLAASSFYKATTGSTLLADRNFFGTVRVMLNPGGKIRTLYHGTTVHGMQFVDANRQGEPLAYYHRAGPCGEAMRLLNARQGSTNVAVIGLGAGAMACYATQGQHWTFYEIDPLVIWLARESGCFSYLRLCTNATTVIVEGDARLRLREAPPRTYDLLVCDAFGSDAPPLHLLNREAMELYLSKLSDHGVLLFHVSSRFLDFRPVLSGLARHFGLEARAGIDGNLSEETLAAGKLPCTWVVLARRPQDFAGLDRDPRWQVLDETSMPLWTDDYSDILGIFQWQ